MALGPEADRAAVIRGLPEVTKPVGATVVEPLAVAAVGFENVIALVPTTVMYGPAGRFLPVSACDPVRSPICFR
jgi:hypothetical protein